MRRYSFDDWIVMSGAIGVVAGIWLGVVYLFLHIFN